MPTAKTAVSDDASTPTLEELVKRLTDLYWFLSNQFNFLHQTTLDLLKLHPHWPDSAFVALVDFKMNLQHALYVWPNDLAERLTERELDKLRARRDRILAQTRCANPSKPNSAPPATQVTS
jgi:hypothetical protein